MNRTVLVWLVLVSGCEGTILSGPTPAPVDPNRLVCGDRPHPAKTMLHRLTAEQYQHAIADIFEGRAQPSAYYPGRFGTPATGFSTEEVVNQVGEQSVLNLQRAAEAVALELDGALGEVLPCAVTTADQPCFDAWVAKYARRAFRRTLTADERASLQRAFDDARASGGSFADALAVVTSLVLQAPQFLYVAEDAAGEGRPLTGVELASRLSFLLWDSVPDDELLALGETEQLTEPAVLAAQARRLFDSPRADAALARYFREWTQAKTLVSTDKDPALFPFFDSGYAASLASSFDRFTVAQARTGTLRSLFTTDEAWVDERLAASYGVAAPAPGTWAKVAVDSTRYAGLVTHPQFLAALSHTQESSFVFRGRTVQRRLLCTPMGEPPADALAVFSAIPLPANPIARERSEVINSNPACAGCHRLLDPPGLALEHFDAVGRYRDHYASGRTVESPGGLLARDGTGPSFDDGVSLARHLVEREELSACFATQLFRFTFSRKETDADGCALQAMGDALAAGDGQLATALLSVTSTEAFTWRADP